MNLCYSKHTWEKGWRNQPANTMPCYLTGKSEGLRLKKVACLRHKNCSSWMLGLAKCLDKILTSAKFKTCFWHPLAATALFFNSWFLVLRHFTACPSGLSIRAGSVPGCGARRLWALVLESATHGSLVPDTGKGVEKIQANQGFMEWDGIHSYSKAQNWAPLTFALLLKKAQNL